MVCDNSAKPLISVIVPAYNLENYIEKCIDSIQRQTYPEIEIIVVDDGSSDRTGDICESRASSDRRIRVFHETNGGPSLARNTGIDRSEGEYLLFVDGDDYIAPNMLETMLGRIIYDNSDLAMCGVTRVNSDDTVCRKVLIPDDLITGYHALEMAYHRDNGVLSCSMIVNKLYKKELFRSIRFPVGKFHEDEATVYKILDRCAWVSTISGAFYYYLNRDNSTMNAGYSVVRLDGVEAVFHRYFYYRNKGGQYLRFLPHEGKAFATLYYESKQLFSPVTKEEKQRALEIDRMAREICFDNFRQWSIARKIKLLAPGLYLRLSKMRRGFRGE